MTIIAPRVELMVVEFPATLDCEVVRVVAVVIVFMYRAVQEWAAEPR